MDRERIPRDESFDEEQQREILRKMLLRLSGKLDKSIGSFAFDLLSPVSIKLSQLNDKNADVESKFIIKNMTGEQLEQRVYELTGIKRKPSTFASGMVTITGVPGTEIEQGTLVATDTIRFATQETVTIGDNGEVEVLVVCEEEGSVGSVSAGMIKQFPVTVQGAETVENKEAFVNGFDAESDDILYERYMEFIRTPATSGNKYHYKQWAKEVDGVGEVKVQGAEEVGAGNVRVVIIDRNQGVASEELIQATKDHIEEKRPIGANVTVATGTPKNIDIVADIRLAERHTLESVTKAFIFGLEEYRKDIAFKETYISYAKVMSILLSSEGVLDVDAMTMNGATDNIALGDEEIPIFTEPKLTPVQREV